MDQNRFCEFLKNIKQLFSKEYSYLRPLRFLENGNFAARATERGRFQKSKKGLNHSTLLYTNTFYTKNNKIFKESHTEIVPHCFFKGTVQRDF